jgi:hypothetical protein
MKPAFISGYEVNTTRDGIPYTLYLKEGVRGINFPCWVGYYNGEWKVSVSGRAIEVDYAICNLKIEPQ